MATIDLTDDDILNALTEECPKSYSWKNKVPTCFPHQRCNDCEDGRVLSFTGWQLARLMQKPAPEFID